MLTWWWVFKAANTVVKCLSYFTIHEFGNRNAAICHLQLGESRSEVEGHMNDLESTNSRLRNRFQRFLSVEDRLQSDRLWIRSARSVHPGPSLASPDQHINQLSWARPWFVLILQHLNRRFADDWNLRHEYGYTVILDDSGLRATALNALPTPASPKLTDSVDSLGVAQKCHRTQHSCKATLQLYAIEDEVLLTHMLPILYQKRELFQQDKAR